MIRTWIYFLVMLASFASNVRAQDIDLPKMLNIEWTRGPDLPQAFQDSDGGIVEDMLITTCGYSDSGETIPPNKKEKSPVGHHKKTWGLNLADHSGGWQVLPDYPGDVRQELLGVAVGKSLLTWGGFSYSPPFTFRDGYRLSKQKGNWDWRPLPDLPWPVCSSSYARTGDAIYVLGGADYRLPDGKFLTNCDYSGRVKRIGARLLFLNAGVLNDGFRERAQCPGTPRLVAAMAAVKGKLYLIGGASGQDNPTGSYCTIVDNWQYDPTTDQWARLTDTPIATGNFPSGQIVFDDRYILLIGGYQYANVVNPDGTTRKSFGRITKHHPDKDYCSDVLVFDTETKTFGRATSLPLNNNMPMAILQGKVLHLLGGETGGSIIDGEAYAHHPDLYLTGEVSLAK
jgi:N-acetylneuraminic acid mutarotase